MSSALPISVILESPDEGVTSVDICGRELVAAWRRRPEQVRVDPVQLRMPRLARALPVIGSRHAALNVDRVLARYPVALAQLRRARRACKPSGDRWFHLTDHVYGHLVRRLPEGRSGVYCHDLDGFAPVLHPELPSRRSTRELARDALAGLREAAVVFHSTDVVGEALRTLQLVDPLRLVKAPLGVAPVFATAPHEAVLHQIRSLTGDRRYLLHVGSDIPRKRLDVLTAVFERLHDADPQLLLVQVGARTLPALSDAAAAATVRLSGIPTELLAGLYAGAALTLVTSDAEGFGMPVIEALAAGSPVLASDLPVFAEVAGATVRTAPVGDVDAFVAGATAVLAEPAGASRAERVAVGTGYTWQRHAEIILHAYQRLAAGKLPSG